MRAASNARLSVAVYGTSIVESYYGSGESGSDSDASAADSDEESSSSSDNRRFAQHELNKNESFNAQVSDTSEHFGELNIGEGMMKIVNSEQPLSSDEVEFVRSALHSLKIPESNDMLEAAEPSSDLSELVNETFLNVDGNTVDQNTARTLRAQAHRTNHESEGSPSSGLRHSQVSYFARPLRPMEYSQFQVLDPSSLGDVVSVQQVPSDFPADITSLVNLDYRAPLSSNADAASSTVPSRARRVHLPPGKVGTASSFEPSKEATHPLDDSATAADEPSARADGSAETRDPRNHGDGLRMNLKLDEYLAERTKELAATHSTSRTIKVL